MDSTQSPYLQQLIILVVKDQWSMVAFTGAMLAPI